MESKDTGILLNQKNLKLQRFYFKQMVKLIGINVIYRQPRENKTYNGHGELDSFYYDPIQIGCIFVEHPNQYTMKKMGWNHELEESTSLIQVPYDTPGIQRGSLFIVPSGIDGAEGRLFQVEDMNNIIVTPAYITCQIAPVFINKFDSNLENFKNSNFNLLKGDDDE